MLLQTFRTGSFSTLAYVGRYVYTGGLESNDTTRLDLEDLNGMIWHSFLLVKISRLEVGF